MVVFYRFWIFDLDSHSVMVGNIDQAIDIIGRQDADDKISWHFLMRTCLIMTQFSQL